MHRQLLLDSLRYRDTRVRYGCYGSARLTAHQQPADLRCRFRFFFLVLENRYACYTIMGNAMRRPTDRMAHWVGRQTEDEIVHRSPRQTTFAHIRENALGEKFCVDQTMAHLK